MNHSTSLEESFIEALFDGPDVIDAIKKELSGDIQWILDWVAENFAPEEVFPRTELEAWAEENGYEVAAGGTS